jgi:4-amino-4-deoxy-L-arabinose transferase-like glycosyltransferase
LQNIVRDFGLLTAILTPSEGTNAAAHDVGLRQDLADGPYIIGLLIVFLVGCAARFYQLDHTPIWMDEAYSYFVSTQPLRTIAFNKIDNHPPLFYVLQHFWNELNPNADLIRFPAAAIGSLTVLVVALATSDLLDRVSGLAAGALLALSTGHIYFSQEARMYTLLCFGLALATWGLVGLMDRERKKLYATIYLVGAGISVYSQAVALIYLVILNGLALACCGLMSTQRNDFLRNWLVANLLLFVVSLPWLLTLREATESFQGLPHDSSLLVQWFFRNIVGFPGLPFPIKQLADMLILLAYALGAVLLWNSGRRTFAILSAGALLIYPAAIALLNLNTPILANRIFIPSLVPAAMLFGCCVAMLKRPLARTALLSTTLVFAAWSAIEAKHLQVKTEDTPQALSLINASGFGTAPILCSNFWTAGTAYFYAPNREIVFPGVDHELVRFNDRMLAAYSLSAAERVHLEDGQMRRMLIDNGLILDPEKDWASVQQVALISASKDLHEKRLLTSLGFTEVATPSLTSPRQLVFQPLSTNISLWKRPSKQ